MRASELIPNAIDEMENPRRNLRRALVIAILASTGIYVIVALAALGNLSPAQIQHDQEYVLAVAARPTMGEFGFVLIGIAALLSTASAINATLFGSARLAMVMASEHALPQVFSLAQPQSPGAVGSADRADRDGAYLRAGGATGGHFDVCQRHLPADLLRHQSLGLAFAPAHRSWRDMAARWRRVHRRELCTLDVAHILQRAAEPVLDRRVLRRGGRSRNRSGAQTRATRAGEPPKPIMTSNIKRLAQPGSAFAAA